MIILSLLIILFIKKHQKPKQKKLNQPPLTRAVFLINLVVTVI